MNYLHNVTATEVVKDYSIVVNTNKTCITKRFYKARMKENCKDTQKDIGKPGQY